MKRLILSRVLALTASAGLVASLAACGQQNPQQGQNTALLSSAPTAQTGWSMSDLAAVDPAFLDRDAAPLPEAVPMRAASGGPYGYAPAYDYGPEPYRDDDYVGDSGPDDYQWLALASALGGMLGNAPPDYAFGYDGVQPWAWETGDRYLRYAEPIYGGYRYYYYEPDSYSPFLVSDPYYSYGYRDDRLVVVYDRSGRLIDARRAVRQRRAAMDYFARAQALYRAGHRDPHYGVSAALWRDHRDDIARAQRRWDDARRERAAWQGWDARNERRLHRDWAGEALVRREAERSFAGWQKADFRTPAPRFYSHRERRAQLQKVAAIRSSPTFVARQEARQHEQRRDLNAMQREAQQQRVAQHQRQVAQQQADRRQQQHQQQVRKTTRQQAAQAQHAKAQKAQEAAAQQRQARGQAQQAARQKQRAQQAAQHRQRVQHQQQRRQQAERAALEHRQEASRQAAQRREHAQAAARSREQQAQSAARQRHAWQAAQQKQAQAQASQRHARQARAEQQQRRAQAQHAAQQQRQAQANQRRAQEAHASQPPRRGGGKDGGGGHGRGRG